MPETPVSQARTIIAETIMTEEEINEYTKFKELFDDIMIDLETYAFHQRMILRHCEPNNLKPSLGE